MKEATKFVCSNLRVKILIGKRSPPPPLSMAMNAIKIQFISSIIILLPVSSLYHVYTIGLYIPTKVLLHATKIFWPQSLFNLARSDVACLGSQRRGRRPCVQPSLPPQPLQLACPGTLAGHLRGWARVYFLGKYLRYTY